MMLPRGEMSRGLLAKMAALSTLTFIVELIAFIICICIVGWLFNLPGPRGESPRYAAMALGYFAAFVAWQLTCWPIRAFKKRIKMRWLNAAVGTPR